MMLDRAHDKSRAAFGERHGPLEGEVDRLAARGSEDHFLGLCAQHSRDLETRLLDRLARRLTATMDTRRVAERLLEPGPHGGHHLGGGPRRRGRIGVNVSQAGAPTAESVWMLTRCASAPAMRRSSCA